VIGPLVPLLPSLTLGKGLASLRMKFGLVVTIIVSEVVRGVGAPAVVACSVTAYLPVAVAEGAVTVTVRFTGEADVGLTVALGEKAQAAPEMLGLKLQLRVTL
jgi:hypothetical protein